MKTVVKLIVSITIALIITAIFIYFSLPFLAQLIPQMIITFTVLTLIDYKWPNTLSHKIDNELDVTKREGEEWPKLS